MTVASGETIRQYFECTGSTTYNFTIPASASTEIEVYKQLLSTGERTLLTEGVDYTIEHAGASYLEGGIVTIDPALSSSYSLVIARETKQSQELDASSANPNSIVSALDKMQRQIQDIQNRLDRCIQLDETDASADLVIPVIRSSKTLGFDENGDLQVS